MTILEYMKQGYKHSQCSTEFPHSEHAFDGKYCVGVRPVTGNDNVPDDTLRTKDISGLSIPAKPGQGAKL